MGTIPPVPVSTGCYRGEEVGSIPHRLLGLHPLSATFSRAYSSCRKRYAGPKKNSGSGLYRGKLSALADATGNVLSRALRAPLRSGHRTDHLHLARRNPFRSVSRGLGSRLAAARDFANRIQRGRIAAASGGTP